MGEQEKRGSKNGGVRESGKESKKKLEKEYQLMQIYSVGEIF